MEPNAHRIFTKGTSGEDSGDGAAIMFLGHVDEKGRGRVMGSCSSVDAQTVGPTIEPAVDFTGLCGGTGGSGRRGVRRRAGLDPGLDGPVLEVGLEPRRGRPFTRGPTGDQFRRFRAARLRAGAARARLARPGQPAVSPSSARTTRVRVTGGLFPSRSSGPRRDLLAGQKGRLDDLAGGLGLSLQGIDPD
jgi:hypothetical protein